RHTRFSRDWSSDVCSSDLIGNRRDDASLKERRKFGGTLDHVGGENLRHDHVREDSSSHFNSPIAGWFPWKSAVPSAPAAKLNGEIGRASCRERVCRSHVVG